MAKTILCGGMKYVVEALIYLITLPLIPSRQGRGNVLLVSLSVPVDFGRYSSPTFFGSIRLLNPTFLFKTAEIRLQISTMAFLFPET